MIKSLFLIAALLAPSLAYAANPSAPFSDQVVSAGSGACSANGTAGTQTMNYPNNTGTATLYWTDCRQVIDGWGIDDDVNDSSGSNGGPTILSGSELNQLFTLNNNGLGLTLLRVWTATDLSNSGSLNGCYNISNAAALGATVWSTQDNTFTGLSYMNGSGQISDYAGLATWMTNWISQVKSQCGVTLYATSVQNEPDLHTGNWQLYENGQLQMRDFIKNKAIFTLTKQRLLERHAPRL
jgi:O-glycosyl hydrolase